MDPQSYPSDAFGAVAREFGNKWAFWYFQPKPIPRELPLDPATVRALSEADAALGELAGLGHLIRDPELLLGSYLTREAVASSRIEGTEASLNDLLVADAQASSEPQSEDVDEVERYLAASRLGLGLAETLPLTQRLIKRVHLVLLTGARGEEKSPGEFRKGPVWVGSATASPETALFVPPLADAVPDLIDDWERFLNEPSQLPVLIRCGLMHYQFETIHPFLDGNGRIGRLLIGLMLVKEGRLDLPLLYVSGFLETHRREYYDRLQAVRERGEIQEWLQFFLTAVEQQSRDAVVRSLELVELRERYLVAAMHERSKVPAMIPLVFANPFVTVKRVEQSLGLSNQGARKIVLRAVELGWIVETDLVGRGGARVWVAEDVMAIVEAPLNTRA